MVYPVYLVDDDRDSRIASSVTMGACGLESRPFASSADLLNSIRELRPGIVLLRVRDLDDTLGPFLRELAGRRIVWPVIVVAEEIDVSQAVAAMKLGALDIVEHPAVKDMLLASLNAASEELTARLQAAGHRERIEILTPRELQVLRALLAGYVNRHIADLLDISERTVEMHRSNLMAHLGVESLAGAIGLALKAGVQPLQRNAA